MICISFEHYSNILLKIQANFDCLLNINKRMETTWKTWDKDGGWAPPWRPILCVCMSRALHFCCQGQNQCCNLVECRYAVIRLERVQFHQVFIWGIGKPQQSSNDVKLSEPGGFQPPRCHHRKFVPLSQPSERFRDCNADFEVGASGLTRFFKSFSFSFALPQAN